MLKKKIKYIGMASFIAVVTLFIMTNIWLLYSEHTGTISKSGIKMRRDSRADHAGGSDVSFRLTPELLWLICNDSIIGDCRFRNRKVIVSGTILEEGRDIDNTSYIVLKAGKIENIGCYLISRTHPAEKPASVGDVVTVCGTYKQYLFNSIVIIDAEIIE
ncbi:MAG: hypothetical protein BGO42_01940 [Flavobacterium sp. 40-81]|nr:MAG: hypothetical protein BGO42_01940 [Flavobacterium sp. 40-81]